MQIKNGYSVLPKHGNAMTSLTHLRVCEQGPKTQPIEERELSSTVERLLDKLFYFCPSSTAGALSASSFFSMALFASADISCGKARHDGME